MEEVSNVFASQLAAEPTWRVQGNSACAQFDTGIGWLELAKLPQCITGVITYVFPKGRLAKRSVPLSWEAIRVLERFVVGSFDETEVVIA